MTHDPSCLFCKIVLAEIPAHKVAEDAHCLAFCDINPQAPTHILIIPKTHIESLHALNPHNASLVSQMALMAQQIASSHNLHEQGYRCVMNTGAGAGQSVFHLHMHLLSGRSFSWPPG